MSAEKRHALVVDDDPGMQELVVSALDKGGFECAVADTGKEACEALQDNVFDLLVIDRKLPDTDGVRLLRQFRAQAISTPAIIITAHPTVPTAVGALQAMAFSYLLKPFDADELLAKAQQALEDESLVDENLYLWEALAEKHDWRHVLSRNRRTQWAYVMAAKAASSNVPVLVEGETGTGKEYLARAIHYMSERADKAFVALNCGGFPDELLENEIFGHEKGAFTSAHAAKVGLCEMADGGTLFLDEISQMSPAMQVKLLRFVEEHSFTRLGGIKPQRVDVRIISASNQPLTEMVERGQFREDLYFRLNVIRVYLPPLRERPEDIGPFAEYFLGQFDAGGKKQLAEQAWVTLRAYAWPGNLRELRNAMHRAVVLGVGDRITEEHLLLEAAVLSPAEEWGATVSLAAQDETVLLLDEVERLHILKVLVACAGDKGAAAEALGISRTTLSRRLKKYEAAA